LAWLLRDTRVTSVLIGSSKPEQIIDSIQALKNTHFTDEELTAINTILSE
jgi:L-glyceraldehyde 3-phosphate reductase